MTRAVLYVLYHLIVICLHGCWSSRPPLPSPLPGKLFSVKINCTREAFNIQLDIGRPFKGIVFAKDFLEECRTKGNRTSSVEISLPASGCGVRSEPRPEGGLELSVRMVIQMDEKLRQQTDKEKIIRCTLPDDLMNMSVGLQEEKPNFRHGRMQHIARESYKKSPRVRVWLELGGKDGAGSVEVGQPTTLGIRAVLPGSIGARIVDCSALDGLGESSQKLLDERGCPVDEQVMPALLTQFRPAEDGWSKSNADDLQEKLFTATFPAFKFPDRERLHVSCGVQLCKSKCPNVNCRSNDPFVLEADKQLARIEVFNSLAVTAPEIEIDRLRSDRRRNATDEYPRVKLVPSDGTLCMSTSKLALAFCALGLIFLVAVIVAVCCLLWAKSKSNQCLRGGNSSVRGANNSIFSSSSSSHSRFGSKLLPYGGSLPYGRVY